MTATTEGTAALAAALAKVQAKLPKLERDRTVTVEPKDPKKAPYSYSYVTLANLSDAILPLLAENGLSFVAMPGAGADGKMCIRYHLLHDSGERLSGEFPISGEGGIQMIGGRITYARRYCLAAIVGVAADEDDESRLSDDGARGTAQRAAPRPRQQQSAPAEAPAQATAQRAQRARPAGPALPGEGGGISDPQQRLLHKLLNDLGKGDRDAGLAYIGGVLEREISTTKTLTTSDASVVIDRLHDDIATQKQEQPV